MATVTLFTSFFQLDRTGLTSNQFCQADTEPFKTQYNVEYTKLNCDFFAKSGFNYSCSLSPYYGVQKCELFFNVNFLFTFQTFLHW